MPPLYSLGPKKTFRGSALYYLRGEALFDSAAFFWKRKKYQFSLFIFEQISCVDIDEGANSEIRYYLEGDNADMLEINPISGRIVTSLTKFMEQNTAKFNISVVATDRGSCNCLFLNFSAAELFTLQNQLS